MLKMSKIFKKNIFQNIMYFKKTCTTFGYKRKSKYKIYSNLIYYYKFSLNIEESRFSGSTIATKYCARRKTLNSF